ncbi:MAG: DUF5680 domain-containing protein [bacterium]|nr:DUF5680 domain-containing protein [bacterium]
MNNEELRQFLINSNKAGYAGGEEKKWKKEPDGSTTIPFEKEKWRSHDNFFGGEPYGGRVVVFYENKPVWIMVYYGWVEKGVEANTVYGVLRNALKQMPKDAPYRGPKEFIYKDFIYSNSWEGTLEKYSGEEEIRQGQKSLYKAFYRGGLVDHSEGV